MIRDFNFNGFGSFVTDMFTAIRATWPFIRRNKLWIGFLEHKWIAVFMVIVATLFSYYVLIDWGWIGGASNLPAEVPVETELLNEAQIPQAAREEGKAAFYSGGKKYLLLILFEVVIFHFSVRTFDILSGQKRITKLTDFMRAEKRMIVVMLYTFVKGLVAHGVVYVALLLIGYSSWTGFVMFFIYAYFLGYAFLDNYNEQFEKSIMESQTIIRQHFWASMTLGICTSGLLVVPLIGPLVAPIFCAIAATIYGHSYIGLSLTK